MEGIAPALVPVVNLFAPQPFDVFLLVFPCALGTKYTRRQQQSSWHVDMLFYLHKCYIVRGTRCDLVVRIAVDSESGTSGKASCMYKVAHQLTASAGRKNKSRRSCFRTYQPEWKFLCELVASLGRIWIYRVSSVRAKHSWVVLLSFDFALDAS